MPLTDELGNLLRDRLDAVRQKGPYRFTGGYFESWLSRLAEAQPDLPDYQNAVNYGLFLRISEELHGLMLEREVEVLGGELPWWLQRLVGLMHVLRTPVITFNYDTLIERAVERLWLSDWISSGRVRPFNLVRAIPPPLNRGGGSIVDRGADSFRLLKLHGSLDCYWVPGDPSGATINRWDLAGGWGAPAMIDRERRREDLPGRAPFIVPPAAAKSSFYGNPITRELWQEASRSLQTADRVVLMGYSLPPTDLVSTGMLVDALVGAHVKVDIVNLYPQEIGDRLEKLGLDPMQIRQFAGRDAIPAFVDLFERESAATIAGQLSSTEESRALLLATSPHRAARVTGLERVGDDVVVTISDVQNAPSVTASQPGQHIKTVAVGDLLARLSSPGTVQVRYNTGEMARVVSVAEWDTDVGLGDGHWAVLVPSAIDLT